MKLIARLIFIAVFSCCFWQRGTILFEDYEGADTWFNLHPNCVAVDSIGTFIVFECWICTSKDNLLTIEERDEQAQDISNKTPRTPMGGILQSISRERGTETPCRAIYRDGY